MSINNQSQFELFPGNSNYYEEFQGIEKKRKSISSCLLTLDRVVMISVGIIMVMVLSFSLGVEKGKKMTIAAVTANASGKIPAKPVVETRSTEVRIQPAAISEQSIIEPEFAVEEVIAQPVEIENIPDDLYTVQVASFKKINQAQEEADVLKKKGFESLVLSKGNYTIVCVGKFERRNQAQLFSSKLKKRYKDCLVRRL